MSEPDSIGAYLKAAREKRGLGVIQVAEKLHVDVTIVEALEAGEFGRVGPPVFVRGHLRHYARLLGEADDVLQGRYTGFDELIEMPDLSAAPRQIMQSRSPARLRWTLVLGLGAALLALLLWFGWASKAVP